MRKSTSLCMAKYTILAALKHRVDQSLQLYYIKAEFPAQNRCHAFLLREQSSEV